MNSIYHIRPRDMIGNVLYPLNMLKAIAPEVYQHQVAKYNDTPERQKLTQQVIPKLDCLWNDVLHFAPIHPHRIYSALLERGQ